MTNIMEFLLARLDDDEAIARNALHSDATEPGVWMSEHHDSEFNLEPNHCHIAEDRAGHYWTVASEVFIPIAEHMARHDPARVLRDVAAKRAVIAALMEIPEVGKDAASAPSASRSRRWPPCIPITLTTRRNGRYDPPSACCEHHRHDECQPGDTRCLGAVRPRHTWLAARHGRQCHEQRSPQ